MNGIWLRRLGGDAGIGKFVCLLVVEGIRTCDLFVSANHMNC